MLQVTNADLLAHKVSAISLMPEEDYPDHYDLLIDMGSVYVLYNTLTQCIFVAYKLMYEDDAALTLALRYGKGLAFNSSNNYVGFTFVVQPDVFTRFRNDLMTSLVSCAVRHYKEAMGLPRDFKKQISKFPFADLLEEQALVVNEPTNSDVVFVSPRFTC